MTAAGYALILGTASVALQVARLVVAVRERRDRLERQQEQQWPVVLDEEWERP